MMFYLQKYIIFFFLTKKSTFYFIICIKELLSEAIPITFRDSLNLTYLIYFLSARCKVCPIRSFFVCKYL